MENQKVFEMLADIECDLFYKKNHNPENEELVKAHKAAREALEAFAKATGCHN